jgi:hypothetical protein
VFWVISVYFNIRNILPNSGKFLLGHPVYTLKIQLTFTFSPFQSNFSANRIIPSSHLFWAGKRLVDYFNYPTVLKEKQKEYNLRCLLAKVCTTCGKASDRIRQRANKCNKNRFGRLPTSERDRKIIRSDEVRRRIGTG